MQTTTENLFLIIGRDQESILLWMEGYLRHWKDHRLTFTPKALILSDLTQAITYIGIDGGKRLWHKMAQNHDPQGVVLLPGWLKISGIGMEIDLWKMSKVTVVLGEHFKDLEVGDNG